MSPAERKRVLVTSLIWASVLAATVAFFLWRQRPHPALVPGSPPPIATAPAASAADTAIVPSQQMEAPLSPVQLSDEQMRSIGMTTGTAEYKQLNGDLRATGNVAINDTLVSYVQVRFSGYIRKVFADATYRYVRKGDPLFTIYSPDLVATQQEYLLAHENQQALSDSSIREVAAGARSLSTAAEHRLEQWQIPESEIAELKRSGKVLNELTIQSPASGYITERNAFPNMYADPAMRLYAIADLSRVWVNAQVFQNDVGRLKAGDMAAIAVDAYPQKTFSGRVEEILPQVDLATRTVPVRLSIGNPGLLLKPGMFVNVDLKSSLGRRLVVPASSVLQTGLKQIVFLDKGNGRIEPKEVVLGPQVGGDIVIVKGLDAHQAIVTSANFLIDSESQLQAASTPNIPAPQDAHAGEGSASQPLVQIEFTTNPDPPRKGSNAIRVKLAAGKGTGIQGADVGVTFFMAAMPAMGMAAINVTARLTEKGSGLYEGAIDLASGGTWQVTVTAKQHGQLIASRKLSVTAKGGM
jgi:Cu(I)/Ag(I) efflux system membrane fusion protein/cobalt-zinc-cadmium efflux system membrane fusion protein